MRHSEEGNDPHEKAESSIGSILFSVLLVILALGFVFGFKYFLATRSYNGPEVSGIADESEDNGSEDHIEMETDDSFKYQYVMIQGLDGKDLWAFKTPGGITAASSGKASEKNTSDQAGAGKDPSAQTKGIKLEEGQILPVKGRGYVDGKLYYLLDHDFYLKDNKSIMPLKENIELEGYLSITYISASGVRLRKWADFDADNVVSSVYVGDKVNVKGKITTVTDISAFVTTEGYYITTSSRYLNDHTNVVEKTDRNEKAVTEATDASQAENTVQDDK